MSSFMGIGKAIAVVTIVALLLFSAAGFVGLAFRRSETKVGVLFAGYTSDSRGILLVRLRIVNEGTMTIRRMRWYTVETKQGWGDTRVLGARNALLAPGASEIVAIPAVTNEGSWRASFSCFPYQLRTRLRERMGPVRLNDPFWKWRLRIWLCPTNGPVYSGWIDALGDAAQRLHAADGSQPFSSDAIRAPVAAGSHR
jgi:hypothetical protein